MPKFRVPFQDTAPADEPASASAPSNGANPFRPKGIDAFHRSICAGDQLDSVGIIRREILIYDWLRESDLGFIFAPRGLGKTWMGLGIGNAIATRGEIGPWKSSVSWPVLYIDGEMPFELIRERVNGMGAPKNLYILNHEVLFHRTDKVLNLTAPDQQKKITDLCLALGMRVIVLDNLGCLFTGIRENDADDWEKVLPWLLTLRRHRIAVIIIHHSGRNSAVMRGTSRREDSAFWVMRLDETTQASPSCGAKFISRFTKNRNSQSEISAYEWRFLTTDGCVDVTYKHASSLDIFKQWIEDGLTSATDIAAEMGLSKGMVSRLAKQAIDAGWLKKTGRGYEKF